MEILPLLLTLLAYHGRSAQRCETVQSPVCYNVGYNQTKYPNTLGHTSQRQAFEDLHPYLPVVNPQCSSDANLFLCALYAPVCTILDEPVLPCRNLCEKVKQGCKPVMELKGVLWPEKWNCENFPGSPNELCVGAMNQTTATPTTTAAVTASPQCESISDGSVCSGVGYNFTQMPNAIGHESQDEANLEVSTYYPLIKINCSPELQLFICSLYLPKCTGGKILPPCRQLCEKARNGCSGLMQAFGHQWPNHMRCETFPNSRDPSVCIDTPSDVVTTVTNSPAGIIALPKKALAFEARYKLKSSCQQQSSAKEWMVLVNSSALANTAHLMDVCKSDCTIQGGPSIGCRNKTLTIKWITDLTYPASTEKIDSALKRKLRKRFKCKKTMLMSVTGVDPVKFQFPVVNKDGTMARMVLVNAY